MRPPLIQPNIAAPNAAHPLGRAMVSSPQEAALMIKARELEASFLAEMLGHAGLGATPEGFGGGIGEEQFASFLRAEQAKAMVAKGGIGLAQSIFESLKDRIDHDT